MLFGSGWSYAVIPLVLGRFAAEQGQTARRTRAAVAALVACVLLSSAAIAVIGNDSRAVALVDEVDGLELNAYLTPNDVEEFKKVIAVNGAGSEISRLVHHEFILC
jgi:hypothetical protein